MHHSQINTRYAKSIFLLAEEKEILGDIKKDMDFLLSALEDNPEINTLLEHPVIKSSKKIQVLNEIFKDKVNKYTMSLLHLIVKNNREKHLNEICRHFVVIYKKSKGIRSAMLTTSFDLSRTHLENIKRSIEKIFKAPVELDSAVDESTIGGMIIQVDDKQLDLSVARQISQLRSKLFDIDFNVQGKI